MTPDDLRAFQAQTGLSNTGCARALGIATYTWLAYKNGHAAIPKLLPMAMAAVTAGLEPWTPPAGRGDAPA